MRALHSGWLGKTLWCCALIVSAAWPSEEILVPAQSDEASLSATEFTKEAAELFPRLSPFMELEGAYQLGNSVTSGFLLPAFRGGAQGNISPFIAYRLMFGQTREVASFQMSQLIPLEAQLSFRVDPFNTNVNQTGVRLGLFVPRLNPLLVSRLSELRFATTHNVLSELSMDRELGAEMTFLTPSKIFELTFGAFNGVGPISLNNSNSRMVSALSQYQFPIDGGSWGLGLSAYSQTQGTDGASSFQHQWNANAYAFFKLPSLSVQIDAIRAQRRTSSLIYSANAMALAAELGVNSQMSLLFRAERLLGSLDATDQQTIINIAPRFELDSAVSLFAEYSIDMTDGGDTIHLFRARFRMIL